MTLSAGDLLGPYRIQALLGAGGMGEVYCARDTRLGRDAALKVIAPRLTGDASLRRRFETEARAASALNHPAVVTIYDVGETDGISWIAMEWVEGRTLRAALADGLMPVARVVAITRQLADALAAAHAKGIVHRDLKPENIMLTEDGRPKILDFGLARQTILEAPDEASSADAPTAFQGGATLDGAIVGTVGYMSPEQASGEKVDFRSDQFAFGLIVYEMLTGRRAFEGRSKVEVLAAIIREEPKPVSSVRGGIGEALQRLVARCLAKNPDARFASTRDLAAELDLIAADVATATSPLTSPLAETQIHPPRPTVEVSARSRRRPGLWIAAALAVALVASLTWLELRPAHDSITSLAILPFENATRDAAADYLGDGLTESLIDQMSRVPSLRVMARTSVSRFRPPVDPRAVGKELGVGAVLVGSIARQQQQLVISAELVDSATGARLWGEKYDRPAADLLRVQDSIVWEIADRLRLTLSGDERRDLLAHSTKNAKAYELYLQGRYLMQHDTEEDDLAAKALFQQAIEKDPKFVDAYSGVATIYTRSAGNGYAPPKDAWPQAEEYLRKALELDPGNFSARANLATRHFLFDWDWALADREFRDLSEDPRMFSHLTYHGAAIYFWAAGRPGQSVAMVERGLRLDPRNVESRVMLADFLAEAGRPADSIREYEAIIKAEPADPRPLFGLANVSRRRAEITAAAEALRKAYELTDELTGVQMLENARTAAQYDAAEVEVARQRLETLVQLAGERYVSPVDLAHLYAKIGDREKAFASLQTAMNERSPGLVFLKVDRAWDPIRDDPRFEALVRRVGIP
jgi:eukaryotic-like serine/threonine-protein kinase